MQNRFVIANSKQTGDKASAAKNIITENAQNDQAELSQSSRVKRRL
jgi:hypothetical protein